MAPIDKPRVVHPTMPIVQGRYKAPERIDKGSFISIRRRGRQCRHQGVRPVGLDHVEIGIEVLEHIPSGKP
jgi:hypothetical protein